MGREEMAKLILVRWFFFKVRKTIHFPLGLEEGSRSCLPCGRWGGRTGSQVLNEASALMAASV